MSGTIYDYACSAGWFFLNGELIRMTNSTAAGLDESINDAYVAITRTSTPLTYNDGSTPNVVNDVYGTLVARPIGTANSPTLFLFKTTEKYGRESVKTQIIVNTLPADGGVGGYIWYRKNFLNNTLQMEGLLGCANAQNFVASPTMTYYTLATLPEGYRPTDPVFFSSHVVAAGGNKVKDDLGIGWISEIDFEIAPNGDVVAFFIKPDASIAGYPLHFNCIVPLD